MKLFSLAQNEKPPWPISLSQLTYKRLSSPIAKPIKYLDMPSIVPKWARNNRAYGSFRRQISNHPRTLILKIILLQLIFWACNMASSFFLSFVTAPNRGILAIFKFENIGIFRGFVNTSYSLAFLINACLGGMAQRFIVDRGRLCLDFSLTCLTIHFIASAILSKGIPWRLDVYGLYFGAVALMTATGVTLCQRHELMPILITSDNQQVLMGKKSGSNEDFASKWRVRLFGGPGQ